MNGKIFWVEDDFNYTALWNMQSIHATALIDGSIMISSCYQKS